VRDSLASIHKAKTQLGYEPKFDVRKGLKVTWENFNNDSTLNPTS